MHGVKEETLKPIIDKLSYSASIEKLIAYEFWRQLYKPFFDILTNAYLPKRFENSKYALKKSLEAGRVQYQDGYIYGPFNAAVSKDIVSLGGVFNKNKKAYKIDLSSMPMDVRSAIAQGSARMAEIKKKFDDQINIMSNKNFSESPLVNVDFNAHLEAVISHVNKQFKSTASEQFEIIPDLSIGARKRISENYTRNMDLYINDWADGAISNLRDKVSENTTAGFRSEKVMKILMAEYGIAERKAKFLARQETSLLVAQMREQRYADVGIAKYRWSTSHDERVRPDHQALQGRLFFFNDPPITDRTSGSRNSPGQDYNCRCVPIPVFSKSATPLERIHS